MLGSALPWACAVLLSDFKLAPWTEEAHPELERLSLDSSKLTNLGFMVTTNSDSMPYASLSDLEWLGAQLQAVPVPPF